MLKLPFNEKKPAIEPGSGTASDLPWPLGAVGTGLSSVEPAPTLDSGEGQPLYFRFSRLGLKCSFLIKYIAGTCNPELSFSYSKVGLVCWGLPFMHRATSLLLWQESSQIVFPHKAATFNSLEKEQNNAILPWPLQKWSHFHSLLIWNT